MLLLQIVLRNGQVLNLEFAGFKPTNLYSHNLHRLGKTAQGLVRAFSQNSGSCDQPESDINLIDKQPIQQSVQENGASVEKKFVGVREISVDDHGGAQLPILGLSCPWRQLQTCR